MGNRWITLILVVVIFFLYLLYFAVQRTILPSGQPIKGLFNGIVNDAQQNQWDSAKQRADELEGVWEKKKYIIMLNYSEADYQIFEDALYRLSAAVETREKYHTISQARMGAKLWENFLKIVPEP